MRHRFVHKCTQHNIIRINECPQVNLRVFTPQHRHRTCPEVRGSLWCCLHSSFRSDSARTGCLRFRRVGVRRWASRRGTRRRTWRSVRPPYGTRSPSPCPPAGCSAAAPSTCMARADTVLVRNEHCSCSVLNTSGSNNCPRGQADPYGEHELVDGVDHEEMQSLERHERFVRVARVLRRAEPHGHVEQRPERHRHWNPMRIRELSPRAELQWI